jgi:hypothetical protein
LAAWPPAVVKVPPTYTLVPAVARAYTTLLVPLTGTGA